MIFRSAFSIIMVSTSVASAEQTSYYGNERGSCYIEPGPIINVRFPLYDDFPSTKPGSTNDTNIAEKAHGIRPNGRLPKSLSPNSITSIQLTVLSQLYTVAFLTQLLNFLTNNEPGYTISDQSERAYVIEIVKASLAQDEQSALAGNNYLESFGAKQALPCKYYWPPEVTDISSATYISSLFDELFVAFLQDIIQQLGQDGDVELIRYYSAMVQTRSGRAGNERSANGMIPSPNAFPTASTREFAYTLTLQATVPGSCPTSNILNLQSFEPLILARSPTTYTSVDQLVQFSVKGVDIQYFSGYSVAYVNQQNMPVVVPVINPEFESGCVTFSAIFPCTLPTFGLGVTLAVVVKQPGPFQDIRALIPDCVYGPAVIYNG